MCFFINTEQKICQLPVSNIAIYWLAEYLTLRAQSPTRSPSRFLPVSRTGDDFARDDFVCGVTARRELRAPLRLGVFALTTTIATKVHSANYPHAARYRRASDKVGRARDFLSRLIITRRVLRITYMYVYVRLKARRRYSLLIQII